MPSSLVPCTALVAADVAGWPLRAQYPALIGRRAIRRRGCIDRRAASKKRVRLRGAAIVCQRAEPGIDRRARAAHLVAVHAVTDARAAAVSDQGEARRDWLTAVVGQVRSCGASVQRHEGVGEPEEGALGGGVDATAPIRGRVARDRNIRESEDATVPIVKAAACAVRRVARDRGVGDVVGCEVVEETASAARGRVIRDRAVRDRDF